MGGELSPLAIKLRGEPVLAHVDARTRARQLRRRC